MKKNNKNKPARFLLILISFCLSVVFVLFGSFFLSFSSTNFCRDEYLKCVEQSSDDISLSFQKFETPKVISDDSSIKARSSSDPFEYYLSYLSFSNDSPDDFNKIAIISSESSGTEAYYSSSHIFVYGNEDWSVLSSGENAFVSKEAAQVIFKARQLNSAQDLIGSSVDLSQGSFSCSLSISAICDGESGSFGTIAGNNIVDFLGPYIVVSPETLKLFPCDGLVSFIKNGLSETMNAQYVNDWFSSFSSNSDSFSFSSPETNQYTSSALEFANSQFRLWIGAALMGFFVFSLLAFLVFANQAKKLFRTNRPFVETLPLAFFSLLFVLIARYTPLVIFGSSFSVLSVVSMQAYFAVCLVSIIVFFFARLILLRNGKSLFELLKSPVISCKIII